MTSHHPSRSESGPRQKAVLFCPDCGHESDVAGDWDVHETSDGHAYDCPSCGTTITRRCDAPPLLSP